MSMLILALFLYLAGCCLAMGLIKWINQQEQEANSLILMPEGFARFSWLFVLYFVFVFLRKFFTPKK